MAKILSIGDKVAFSQNVIRRTMDGSNARGVVVSVSDKTAAIDFKDTWIKHEDGGTIRHVPIANLTKILANGVIFSD